MHLRNVTFALLALAVSPALCPAGPIDFSYTATSDVRPNSGPYSPGDLTFHLDAAGEIHLPASGGSVELGAVVLGPPTGPQGQESYTAQTNFTVSVVVTDLRSKRSAELRLHGGAVDAWDYREWDGRWSNAQHRLELGDSFSGNASETSAHVGNTRYTLAIRPQNDDQEGVYTLTATVHNPEPGTFALAALGLVPLAARLVRRKRN